MTMFDESGIPLELNKLVQKYQADIKEKLSIVATEKQLIKELENEIKEKQDATIKLGSENQQLEMAIQHTSYIFENQKHQLKLLQETAETLKIQVKMREEVFGNEQETNTKILDQCEAKYQEYQEMVQKRMQQYDQMPMVAKFREKQGELIELQQIVEIRKKENEKLKLDIEETKAKRDPSNLKYKTIEEWGVALAKQMIKLKKDEEDVPERLRRIHKLKLEVEDLQKRKREIEANHQKTEQVVRRNVQDRIENGSILPSTSMDYSNDQQKFKLASMVPRFEGFFKTKTDTNKQQTGSSGSSMRSGSFSNSLPNIPSLFSSTIPMNTTKSMEHLDVKLPATELVSSKKTETVTSGKGECAGSSMQRSRSLSLLIPRINSIKKSETAKSTSMLGRPLSDWLKSSPSKETKLAEGNETMEVCSASAAEINNKKNISPKKSSFTYERPSFKWPQLPSIQMTTDKKVTEVPLIRQVQEKMIQKKAIEQGEKLLQDHVVSHVNEEEEVMEVVEDSKHLPSQEDGNKAGSMLNLFDGPVYDVTMPSPEEDASEKLDVMKSPASSNCSSTATTPDLNRSILEEHRKMLDEIEKSPGFDFSMASNFMSTGGGQDSFMIGQKTPSPPVKSKHFQFAVPEAPGPGSKKKFKSPESSFFLNFGSEKVDGQQDSPPDFSANFSGFGGNSSPSGFNFGSNAEEPSTIDNTPFTFAFPQESEASSSSECSGSNSNGFSFGSMFGKESNSPSANDGFFSFNLGGGNDVQTENQSMFTFGSENPEQQSEFLFSTAFGCKK